MRAITKGRMVPIIMALMVGMAGATAWSAVTGVVSGTVVAAETGAALSGANVVVVDTRNTPTRS